MVKKVIGIALSLGLLYLALRNAGFENLSSLRAIDFSHGVLITLVLLTAHVLSAFRLHSVFTHQGLRKTKKEVIQGTFLIHFISQGLNFAGSSDLTKYFVFASRKERLLKAVFVDKIIILTTPIGVLGSLYFPPLLLLLVLALTLNLSKGIVLGIFWNACSFLLMALAFAMVAVALGEPQSSALVVGSVKVLFFTAVFPFSFVDWGIRECFSTTVFTGQETLFLNVSLLYGMLMFVSAIPGGILLLLNRRLRLRSQKVVHG